MTGPILRAIRHPTNGPPARLGLLPFRFGTMGSLMIADDRDRLDRLNFNGDLLPGAGDADAILNARAPGRRKTPKLSAL